MPSSTQTLALLSFTKTSQFIQVHTTAKKSELCSTVIDKKPLLTVPLSTVIDKKPLANGLFDNFNAIIPHDERERGTIY